MIKKKTIINILLVMVLLMAVGYASFATTLNISGTTSISSRWDVRIISITGKNIVGGATDAFIPSFSNTSASFATNLISPGDSKTYDIVIENNGTLDAKVTNIIQENDNNPAIIYNASGISNDTVILAGSTKTYTIIVTYNPDITTQPTNLTNNFIIKFNFVQA